MSFAVCVCVCVCVKCDVYNSALPLLRINLSRWLKSKSSSQILFGCRISFEMKTISIDAFIYRRSSRWLMLQKLLLLAQKNKKI